MARKASTSDFEVNVPTVGRYVFARRSVGDSFKIRGMYDQLTAGCYDEEGRMQDLAALGFCSVKVLAVEQPKDFHIESIDPLMDD